MAPVETERRVGKDPLARLQSNGAAAPNWAVQPAHRHPVVHLRRRRAMASDDPKQRLAVKVVFSARPFRRGDSLSPCAQRLRLVRGVGLPEGAEPRLERRAQRGHLGREGRREGRIELVIEGRDLTNTRVARGRVRAHGGDRRLRVVRVGGAWHRAHVQQPLQTSQVCQQQQRLVKPLHQAHKVKRGEEGAQQGTLLGALARAAGDRGPRWQLAIGAGRVVELRVLPALRLPIFRVHAQELGPSRVDRTQHDRALQVARRPVENGRAEEGRVARLTPRDCPAVEGDVVRRRLAQPRHEHHGALAAERDLLQRRRGPKRGEDRAHAHARVVVLREEAKWCAAIPVRAARVARAQQRARQRVSHLPVLVQSIAPKAPAVQHVVGIHDVAQRTATILVRMTLEDDRARLQRRHQPRGERALCHSENLFARVNV